MTEDGGDRAGQIFEDNCQNRLTTTTAERSRRTNIQAIFGDIEIEVGQIDDAEILNQLEEFKELISAVGLDSEL